jgi:hypothetical protein
LLILGWEPTFNEQIISQHDPIRFIYVKNLNGHLAGERFSHEHRAFPVKVAMPILLARIKERVNSALQKAGKVSSLGPVAPGASIAEPVGIVRTAMLPGDNVFDMKRQEIRIILMQAAVLTALSRSRANECSQRCIHLKTLGLAQ